MTKQEFYTEYKDNPIVDMGDIIGLISDEELYEEVEIKDSYDYEEWIYNEINYILSNDGWQDLRDYLNGIDDYSEYHVFRQGVEDEGISGSDRDIENLLDEIEKLLAYEYNWEDENVDSENQEEIQNDVMLLFETS